MEPVSKNIRLLQRAYWLIRLRWIAIVFVGAGVYVSGNLLGIELQNAALCSIAILPAVYNLTVLLLNHFAKKGNDVSHSAVKKIINVQITEFVV